MTGYNAGATPRGFSDAFISLEILMEAYDGLPQRLRFLVGDAPVPWNPIEVGQAVQMYGEDGAEQLVRQQNHRIRQQIRAETIQIAYDAEYWSRFRAAMMGARAGA